MHEVDEGCVEAVELDLGRALNPGSRMELVGLPSHQARDRKDGDEEP
jgi:hypothetical protein